MKQEGQNGGRDRTMAVEAVSGFISGLLQTIVCHPLDVIKTRMQSQFDAVDGR